MTAGTDAPLLCEGCGAAFEEDGNGVLVGNIEICEGCGLVLCGDCGSEMSGRDTKRCDTCLKLKD